MCDVSSSLSGGSLVSAVGPRVSVPVSGPGSSSSSSKVSLIYMYKKYVTMGTDLSLICLCRPCRSVEIPFVKGLFFPVYGEVSS